MNNIDNILKDYLKYKGGNINDINNNINNKQEKINKLIDKITGLGEVKKIVEIKAIVETDDPDFFKKHLTESFEKINNLHKTDKKINPVINQFYSSSENEF